MARATTQPARRPRGLFGTRSPISDSEDNQSSTPGATSKSTETGPSAPRRWRRRGDARRADTEPRAGGGQGQPVSAKAEGEDADTKSKRRSGSRRGRGRRRKTESGANASGHTAAGQVQRR